MTRPHPPHITAVSFLPPVTMAMVFPSACRCNAEGSLGPSCSKLGGVCDCKPNVIGRCCDACAPMTFGFGPDGCEGLASAWQAAAVCQDSG